ncbi:mucin-4-like [Limulus polyphemus]|uniref:Mucin-4-like n=1 Tax=Limulus polyphemus TaxID=6850 RepID=A0ABM1C3R2_LIMPO|nr:mucin-4-like [Limulus polyphemus]
MATSSSLTPIGSWSGRKHSGRKLHKNKENRCLSKLSRKYQTLHQGESPSRVSPTVKTMSPSPVFETTPQMRKSVELFSVLYNEFLKSTSIETSCGSEADKLNLEAIKNISKENECLPNDSKNSPVQHLSKSSISDIKLLEPKTNKTRISSTKLSESQDSLSIKNVLKECNFTTTSAVNAKQSGSEDIFLEDSPLMESTRIDFRQCTIPSSKKLSVDTHEGLVVNNVNVLSDKALIHKKHFKNDEVGVNSSVSGKSCLPGKVSKTNNSKNVIQCTEHEMKVLAHTGSIIVISDSEDEKTKKPNKACHVGGSSEMALCRKLSFKSSSSSPETNNISEGVDSNRKPQSAIPKMLSTSNPSQEKPVQSKVNNKSLNRKAKCQPKVTPQQCSTALSKMKVLQDLFSSEDDSPPPLSHRLRGLTPSKKLEDKQTRLEQNGRISQKPLTTSLSSSGSEGSLPSQRRPKSSSESEEEFEKFLDRMKTPAKYCPSSSSDDNFINDSTEEDESFEKVLHLALSERAFASSKVGHELRQESCGGICKTALTITGQKKNDKVFRSNPLATCPRVGIKKIIKQRIESPIVHDEVFCNPKNITPAPKITSNRFNNVTPSVKSVSHRDLTSKESFIASLSSFVPVNKANCEAVDFRTHFKSKKEQLTKRLYNMYNEKVFNNELPSDLSITWNPRLRKTAGCCYYRKHSSSLNRVARIELAPKVIDSADRLRDTLIHELCHAASWIINGYRDGHGPIWKTWARKASLQFPELPPITRCHGYVIQTKYTYRCIRCGTCVGRHSKSLDVNSKVCGRCGGKFELLVNGKLNSASKTPSGFALYVKENYGSLKKTNQHLKHAEIMRLLGLDFSSKAKIVD